METRVVKIDPNRIEKDELKEAAKILRNGGLVAFPTETVYGLGGDGLLPEASKKIYEAKGRPSDNPLIIHIAETEDLRRLSKDGNVPPEAKLLAEKYWPGPLTMIVEKADDVPYETTGGLDTVAVRMPSHPVARALIKESGVLIAAPSANMSGRPSPTEASHVIEDLSGRIDCIIDGGSVEIGLESTIIDLSEDIPTVLRPGYITIEDLEETLGKGRVRMDPGLMTEEGRPKAPGMRYRHYAPKGELSIVEGGREQVIKKINDLAAEAKNAGKRTGVIACIDTAKEYEADIVLTIGNREDEESIARNLYRILREMDEDGAEVIYSEGFDEIHLGNAIMNRLVKAAGHHKILA
jgi:L-threonylcarbamoyladenylate synthase